MRIRRVPREEIERKKRTYGQDYWSTLAPALALNEQGEITGVDVEHPAYAEAKIVGEKYKAVKVVHPRHQPVPRKEWPTWAFEFADKAHDDDRGVGDSVARTIGPFGSGVFKAWYKSFFGTSCGCEDRQREWNEKYPYKLS